MLNLVAAASFYAVSIFCHPVFADNAHAIESCAIITSKKSPHSTKSACDEDLTTGIRLFNEGGYTRMLEDQGASVSFVCKESETEPTSEELFKEFGPKKGERS